MMRTYRESRLACLLVVLAAAGTTARGQNYQLIDLGTLGGAESAAAAINTTGRMVGAAQNASGDKRAFRTGLLLPINGATDDLGDLGGIEAIAHAINDNGLVAGAGLTGTGDWHAFLFNAGMLDLLTLGGPNSAALGINATGKVVGESEVATGEVHAFLYRSGILTDLGTLGGANSRARGIGPAGRIVGGAENALGDIRAFRTAAYLAINPATDDLGTLGGAASEAFAINSTNVTVGRAQDAVGDWNAFRFDGGGMTTLGTLGGPNSSALGINTAGAIVGSSETAPGDTHAFLWVSGVMTDLNTLIGASNWTLVAATSINDSGSIVGYGLLNGDTRAILLKPIKVKTVTLAPASVVGSLTSIGTVTLNFPVPADTVVALSETHSAATVPATVTVLAGAKTATFTVSTTAVTVNTAGDIKATYGGITKKAALTVKPVPPKSVTLTPATVTGGTPSTGKVTLKAPAGPGNITVTLSSTLPGVASVPASVVVLAGATTKTFTVTTFAVALTKMPVISATAAGVTKSATLTVNP